MSTIAVMRALSPAEAGADTEATRAVTIDLILQLTRLRARRLVLWMEQAWQAGRSSPDQGLAITSGEVTWLLAGEDAAGEQAAFLASDPRAAALGAGVLQAEAALARDPTWRAVVGAFALDAAEADMLGLLAAAEADPGLQRVMAYLHDDVRMTRPTPDLCARLTGRREAPWRGEAFRRWRLASPIDDGPPQALTTAWRIDPAVFGALRDAAWRDLAIDEGVSVVGAEDCADCAPLHQAAMAALLVARDLAEVELTGPKGIGRQTLAARFAHARGQALLAADVPLLLARGVEARAAVTLVLRQARFTGALAYFRDADAVPSAEWALARRLGVEFLRGSRLGAASENPVALAPLSAGDRLALWRTWSPASPPAALRTHRLTPGEIRRLAAASSDGAPIRIGGARPDHALLAPLPCPYEWSDLILPADVDRHLREFADQVRLRWSVYDDWGFGRLAHLGFGVAALFVGPSGTGKTMAAQVIARSLGLDLYRVDLAGVVNKYVGETEKRLREVFDACEHAGALLFFDEADALFGSRMQVKDAHDRFANIETNYLLQRIETFDGVVILATNRRNDIDQAFLRRLRFVIEFLPPRSEERLALWRWALPPRSPAGEELLDDIDWSLLAERLQMTGAEIKNTALAAAFLAHAEGARIGMRHVIAAAEREVAKQRTKLPVSLRGGSPG
jgi:hypothetical protein